MLNVLLNRYYLHNVNRAISPVQPRENRLSIIAGAKKDAEKTPAAQKSLRGKAQHDALQGELLGIWARHLSKEKEQKYCQKKFLKNN